MSESEGKSKAFLCDFKNGSLTESPLETQEIAGLCQNHSELFTDSKTSHPIPGDGVIQWRLKAHSVLVTRETQVLLGYQFHFSAKQKGRVSLEETEYLLSAKRPQRTRAV